MFQEQSLAPVIFIGFLVIFALALLAASLGFRYLEAERKKRVAGMLQTAAGRAPAPPRTSLLEPRRAGKALADQLLSRFNFVRGVESRIRQADLSWSLGKLLALTLLAGAAGAAVGLRMRVPLFREAAVIGFAVLLGMLPYLYILRKRAVRLAAFEEQFPEALDFLARSMKAGHAFAVSLEMLGSESPEPLGKEFRRLYHEQNFGSPLATALRNLGERVPLVDVRFFVSAVLLQKETGGDLAEILTKLSYVIRERFRLKGQVRAVSAHGRLTAIILTVMPIVLTFALLVVAPGYLEGMARDSDGKYLILAAIAAQGIGYLCIRHIVNIRI